MSWDIVLFNSTEKISSPEDLDDSKLFPTDFDAILGSHFPNTVIDDDHREISGIDYSISYFTDDELTSNKMLSLYGEAALFQLISLAVKNNWQIFDTGNGQMIDLDNPAKNGYANFQAYLAQVISGKETS